MVTVMMKKMTTEVTIVLVLRFKLIENRLIND